MFQSSPRVTMLTITCLLCISGQEMFVSGSVIAEDSDPVAVDLVPLALAIPEALADIEEANERLPSLALKQQKGIVTQAEVDTLQKQRTKATRQLELLRFIVDAEIKSASNRSEHFQRLQKADTQPLGTERSEAVLGNMQTRERL